MASVHPPGHSRSCPSPHTGTAGHHSHSPLFMLSFCNWQPIGPASGITSLPQWVSGWVPRWGAEWDWCIDGNGGRHIAPRQLRTSDALASQSRTPYPCRACAAWLWSLGAASLCLKSVPLPAPSPPSPPLSQLGRGLSSSRSQTCSQGLSLRKELFKVTP